VLRLYSGATGAIIRNRRFIDPMQSTDKFEFGAALDTTDGDGVQALVVGAPGLEWDGRNAGHVFIVSGAHCGTLQSYSASL
jgi:hypothetical protein